MSYVKIILLLLILQVTNEILIKAQNEILSTFSKTNHSMISPLSDMTISVGIAPDDEGDIQEGIFIIGGCKDGYYYLNNDYYCSEVTADVSIYDPVLGFFAKRMPAISPRYRHGSVSINGLIWVIGGRDKDDNIIPFVDVYQPYFNTWIRLGVLSDEVIVTSDFCIFSKGPLLYFMGGFDEDYHAVEKVYRIDAQDVWDDYQIQKSNTDDKDDDELSMIIPVTELAHMSIPRGDINGILFGRYIYIMGGMTHVNHFCKALSTVEAYDIDGNRWIALSDMNIGRADMSVIKYHSVFYVLGGEVPVLDTCSTSSSNSDNSTTEIYNKFTVDTMPLPSIEVYDPLQGTSSPWKIVTQVTLPKLTQSQSESYYFRYTVAPWQYKDSVFIFGGVFFNSNDISTNLHSTISNYDNQECKDSYYNNNQNNQNPQQQKSKTEKEQSYYNCLKFRASDKVFILSTDVHADQINLLNTIHTTHAFFATTFFLIMVCCCFYIPCYNNKRRRRNASISTAVQDNMPLFINTSIPEDEDDTWTYALESSDITNDDNFIELDSFPTTTDQQSQQPKN